MGKAIDYTLPRWAGLSTYTLHGQMEIDNNLIENAVRPLAIAERTFFLRDHIRQPRWLPGCTPSWPAAKKNKINEFTWLKDVFERIQSHKQNYLYQLLPSNWNQHRIN
jgi:hypothetical protein